MTLIAEQTAGLGRRVTQNPHAHRPNKPRAKTLLTAENSVRGASQSKSRAGGPIHPNPALPATSQTPPGSKTKLASSGMMPPAAPNASGQVRSDAHAGFAAHADDGRAMNGMPPGQVLPAPVGHAYRDPQSSDADGRAAPATSTKGHMPALIGPIRELHAQRQASIRMTIRIDNQCRSLVRRFLGWQYDAPEKERERVNAAAAALVESIQAGEAVAPEHEPLVPFCIMARETRRQPVAFRDGIEKSLRKLAAQLPVYPWAESVKGFGALGLSAIVGEAGDLSGYANPAKLWKRFGLHVVDSRAARNEAGKVGHSARRRSVSWVIADSLLRQDNAYSRLYRERREYERARNPDFDKGVDPKTGKQKVSLHCDRRARRYAEKRFLRDLWRAWRDSAGT